MAQATVQMEVCPLVSQRTVGKRAVSQGKDTNRELRVTAKLIN